MPEQLEFPTACLASVKTFGNDIDLGQGPTLSSLVNKVDYPELKHSLLELLGQYRDIIELSGEPLGAADYVEHHTQLKPEAKPVYISAYWLPHSQREEIAEHIKDMPKQGVIQHSCFLWNSLIFSELKRNGSFHPVMDFQKVNEITTDDRFLLPILKDLLMSLGQGNKTFTSIDLLLGYWQVLTYG